jgi:glucose-6-phosphate dehydrogenase assembly protein OpcA
MASALNETPVRTSRASTPESIDADLAALWRELAQIDAPIARAVMSNLVVVRDRLDVDGAELEAMLAGLPIDEVVARHPSRLIVLEHEAGREDPAAPFAAAVGIVVFGSTEARYGVEEIAVRAACAEASLPSIVRRYIRGDLPTSVWWTADVADRPPLEAFVTIGRQLVYDSRGWRDVRAGIRALAPIVAERRIDLADVNWRRLTPLRQALEQLAGTGTPAAFFAGAEIRIVHRAEDGALAWLLAGWALAAAKPAPVAVVTEVADSAGEDVVLAIAIRRGDREVVVTLASRSVVITESGSAVAPLVVGIAVETQAEAIAAELRTLAYDVALHDAIAALIRHFGAE